MTGFKNIVKSVISDYGKHLSGSKIRELEEQDALSKSLLQQHLCTANSRRTVFFSVPAVIIAIVFSAVTIMSMSVNDIRESVLSLAGLLVIVVGCGSLAVLVYREFRRKKLNLKKLKSLIIFFWLCFSLALMLISLADLSFNVYTRRYYLFLTVMAVFPLLNLKQSLFIMVPYLVFSVTLGAIFGADFLTLFFTVVFSLAYLLISSLVYTSYCCLFISDRKLNTANERCRQINEKDSLTGVLNKKGLLHRLTDIIDRGADGNIAAVFFGVDNFKEYNRTHTDSEGDECLYNICKCVQIVAKPVTDIMARYSGDEFVLIVENTKEYDLVAFAEQIRKNVERMALPDGNDGIMTATVGVSSIADGDFFDYSKLLKEAEDNLALAKKSGKNCVGYMGNVFKVK